MANEDKDGDMRNFAKKLESALDFRFDALLGDDLYVVAALLDPNIRLGFCQDAAKHVAHKEKLVQLLCRLENDAPTVNPTKSQNSTQQQKKESLFGCMKWNPAPQASLAPDAVSKTHAALEVDNYFADLVPDDEINPLKYWKINSVRFPMLSKLAIEIYSCPATTAGIERVFSVAGHLLGPRATTMKDENFEKKLFCNINQEVMLSGRKRKYIDIS